MPMNEVEIVAGVINSQGTKIGVGYFGNCKYIITYKPDIRTILTFQEGVGLIQGIPCGCVWELSVPTVKTVTGKYITDTGFPPEHGARRLFRAIKDFEIYYTGRYEISYTITPLDLPAAHDATQAPSSQETDS